MSPQNKQELHPFANTMDPFYYLFLALLLPLLLFFTRCRAPAAGIAGLRPPPGPRPLPVIGSLHHLLGALPHRAMRDLSRRHGPLMLLRLGEVATLVVSSAGAAREIMKTHDITFATRPQTTTIRILTKEGHGVAFAPYGDHWRQLRKLCMLELLSAKRVQSFRRVREEEAARLVRHVMSLSHSSQLVNVSDRIMAYITDSVVRAVMGDRISDRDAFLRNLDEGIRVAAGFSLADLFPSSRLACMLSGTARKAEVHYRAMTRLMDSIIREHQARRSADAEDEDLIDVLLRNQKEGGLQFPLTMGTIRALIIDLLSAGSETSATTLQWAMAELMRNPRMMHKAQAEVRQVLAGQMQVTEEALGELRYLQLVIKETLRLHPPVPLLLPRECQETCQILGYDVPKGAMVLVNAWAIGRDPEYWYDAEEFNPKRFEGSTIDFRGTDFEFIPFGAGRRICPGMSFGVASMELALASLLFHFDWDLPNGVTLDKLDMTEAFGITARRMSDLWLHPILRVPFPTI